LRKSFIGKSEVIFLAFALDQLWNIYLWD